MLAGRSLAEIEALYRQREPYYGGAHLTIDTTGLGRRPGRCARGVDASPEERMPSALDRDPAFLGAAASARSRARRDAVAGRARGGLSGPHPGSGRRSAGLGTRRRGRSARQRSASRAGGTGPGRSRGVLHGIPVGIKDIIHVAGMPTRAGAAFAHSVPAHDAAVVTRLRAAGAVILGKTHTTQFALRDPAPTRNPWNPRAHPGGLVGRLGRRGRRAHDSPRSRNPDRGIGAATGRLLRRDRLQGDVRARPSSMG